MKLITCNTYSQLIIAIQLKLTLFKNEQVDLWISDHSNNVDKIIEPLKVIALFNDVRYVREKEFVYNRSKLGAVHDAIEYSLGKIKKLDVLEYSEVIFYSLSLMLYSLADYYELIGHKTMWSRMEEGLFSYETDFESGNRIKLARKLRRLSNRVEIANNIQNYYCFFPTLKENHLEWNLIKIPSISENSREMSFLLKRIFDLDEKSLPYKYIFFASSADIDGCPYGEIDVILKVAEIVGSDNLIIKTHPRDTRTVYEEHGITVMHNSWIPWEVIQLAGDYSNKTMLTVNSGAFITISALQGKAIKGRFLFSAVKEKDEYFIERERKIKVMLDKLHRCGLCTDIQSASYEDL